MGWLENFSTGVLASILATCIIAVFSGVTVWKRVQRRNKVKIESSEIGGDIVSGDKGNRLSTEDPNRSVIDSRKSSIYMKNSKVKGDIVQGDKKN